MNEDNYCHCMMLEGVVMDAFLTVRKTERLLTCNVAGLVYEMGLSSQFLV